MTAAQAEMNSIGAERKLLTVLTREISRAAYRIYQVGEDVLVYSIEKVQEYQTIYRRR